MLTKTHASASVGFITWPRSRKNESN